MIPSRLGMTLLAFAERVCETESIDTVVLPIVADIQFEVKASAHRSPLARAWVRARGYGSFFNAIALTVLLGCGRNPMNSKALGWVRLLLAVPLALLVTAGVQLAATRLFGMMLMHPGERLASGLVLLEGVNTTKVVSSPFMSAAFFWTMYLVAPPHRRSPVAIGALIVTGLWGALMVFGSVMPGPGFHSWLFGIGMAHWLGGGVSYWLARRFQPATERVA
jgi:hypothetical protein